MEMWADHITGRRKSVAKAKSMCMADAEKNGQSYIKCMKKILMWLFWLFHACKPQPCAWNTEHRTQTLPTETGE